MFRNPPTPIILITGFLGSGKTTLIRHWLDTGTLPNTRLIVNELGEVGLDHSMLSNSGDQAVLLDNGCACCTVFENLAETLETLYWQRLHRTISWFDQVVIETTGIADPVEILRRLSSHPLVSERYAVAGVITLTDPHLLQLSGDSQQCHRRQLQAADVVVLTKTDLHRDDEISTAKAILSRLSRSPVVLSGLIYPDLTELKSALMPDTPSLRFSPAPDGPWRSITPKTASTFRHTFHHGFLRLEGAVELEPFIPMLMNALSQHQIHLVRAKGWIQDAQRLCLVQFSLGTGWQIRPDTAKAETATGLTLISDNRPLDACIQELTETLDSAHTPGD